ncbi:MAG: AAA family ATPase [Desulfuromonadaceae bacterium]|nr:AAA family ATPase [Desulfuromonadaceae bacterium]
MIERRLHSKLDALLNKNPAVVLIGPRQAGKTTLALEIVSARNALYLDLESPRDLAKLSDIEQFCQANADKLLVLDEVQRLPELFAPLRSIIDQRRRSGQKYGQFLLLGSASVELLKQSSESLAGRIALAELFPLDALEIEPTSTAVQSLWLRGGFPESCLAENDTASLDWRWDFIRTYLEKDIPLLGPRIPAETLRRLWTMLAHNQGATLNASNLAAGLGVSGQTIGRYIDLLVDLLLIRRLQPWRSNVGKRLVKTPKVYVRDSGIVHALLGIEDFNSLLGHPVVGGSWEGFVIENILASISERIPRSFYRTSGGAEIDLILEPAASERWAIEIKLSTAPKVKKGFYSACDDIQATRKILIYSGEDSFPMKDNVEAMGLQSFMKELT